MFHQIRLVSAARFPSPSPSSLRCSNRRNDFQGFYDAECLWIKTYYLWLSGAVDDLIGRNAEEIISRSGPRNKQAAIKCQKAQSSFGDMKMLL